MPERAPLNTRELAIVSLSMFAVVVGGLWGMTQLLRAVERSDPFAAADRACAGLAADGVDSDERHACLERELAAEPLRWRAMIGPGALLAAGFGGATAALIAHRRAAQPVASPPASPSRTAPHTHQG